MSSLQEMLKKKKAAIAAQSGRRESTVKPTQGANRFRILPTWRAADHAEPLQFHHDFGAHFVKDTLDKLKAVYVCVDKTYGKPCSICEQIENGINSVGTDEQKNALSESQARQRILLNALQLDGANKATPIILELSPTTFDQVIDIVINNPGEEGDENFNVVTDAERGVDIIITRTGAGIDTKYSVQPALSGSKSVAPSILANLHNLDEYVAQEYEAGVTKALSAVSAVTGLLPAPSKALTSDAPFDDDVPDFSSEATAAASAPKKAKLDAGAVDADFEEVTEPEAVTPDISDDELDSLLDELD